MNGSRRSLRSVTGARRSWNKSSTSCVRSSTGWTSPTRQGDRPFLGSSRGASTVNPFLDDAPATPLAALDELFDHSYAAAFQRLEARMVLSLPPDALRDLVRPFMPTEDS